MKSIKTTSFESIGYSYLMVHISKIVLFVDISRSTFSKVTSLLHKCLLKMHSQLTTNQFAEPQERSFQLAIVLLLCTCSQNTCKNWTELAIIKGKSSRTSQSKFCYLTKIYTRAIPQATSFCHKPSFCRLELVGMKLEPTKILSSEDHLFVIVACVVHCTPISMLLLFFVVATLFWLCMGNTLSSFSSWISTYHVTCVCIYFYECTGVAAAECMHALPTMLHLNLLSY